MGISTCISELRLIFQNSYFYLEISACSGNSNFHFRILTCTGISDLYLTIHIDTANPVSPCPSYKTNMTAGRQMNLSNASRGHIGLVPTTFCWTPTNSFFSEHGLRSGGPRSGRNRNNKMSLPRAGRHEKRRTSLAAVTATTRPTDVVITQFETTNAGWLRVTNTDRSAPL